ncbi:O-antigen ligase family protein [Priestia megaterium]|uniref:O-antigen ligase family protein n=1 Tax=Priestia megaterium TaxID=1404 RepID=UPI0022208079|nr:O-antigen ligase family protein [Priestia megaterium]UYV54086.1 O-antigen ligase family protein [Priestia megaterium]
MDILYYRFKIPKINFLTVLFLLSILKNYKVPSAFDYVIILLILGAIALNVFPVFKYTDNSMKINKLTVFVWVISFAFLIGTSLYLDTRKYFMTVYLPFYLISFYSYIKVIKMGHEFSFQFFKQFLIVMNVFSIFNLYQVVFRKPLLLNLLADKFYTFQYGALGTGEFRTISVFGHPIVCGLFFVMAFICNIYILKSGILKNVLQLLLIINVYSTGSRSSWISLVVILGIMIIPKLSGLKIKKIKLTKSNIFSLYSSFCILIVGFFFLVINFSNITQAIVDRFGSSLSANSTDVSNTQRIGTLNLIFKNFEYNDIIHQLFGNGVSAANKFMAQNRVVIQDFLTTDNQYLTILHDFGLVGLSFVFILLISFLINTIKRGSTVVHKISLYFMIVIAIDSFFFESVGGWLDLLVMMSAITTFLSIRPKTAEVNQHSNVSQKTINQHEIPNHVNSYQKEA